MKRLLILKDQEQNTLLEARLLEETANISYTIIDEPPEIEAKEGYTGRYALDEAGNLTVTYEAIPKSETELLKERIERLEQENISITQLVTTNTLL